MTSEIGSSLNSVPSSSTAGRRRVTIADENKGRQDSFQMDKSASKMQNKEKLTENNGNVRLIVETDL